MKFDELISSLGVRLGISNLVFDVNQSCIMLKFDDDLVLFEKSGNKLVISAELGSAIGKENLYKQMLEASNAGLHTGLNNLGFDRDRLAFVLSFTLENIIEPEKLEARLMRFILAVRQWKKIVDSGGVIREEPTPADFLV